MLVDCDHTLRQQWKLAHNGIVRSLGCLHGEADQDCIILSLRILLRKTNGVRKNVEFAHWQHLMSCMLHYLIIC